MSNPEVSVLGLIALTVMLVTIALVANRAMSKMRPTRFKLHLGTPKFLSLDIEIEGASDDAELENGPKAKPED